MDLPLYLAMTAGEFQSAPSLPRHCAWMACHFSQSGSGLSNLPDSLPEESILILDDSLPFSGHETQRIFSQLEELIHHINIDGILLDFQREKSEDLQILADLLATLPVPVGVTEAYAQGRRCPVFLSACPPYVPVKGYLEKWKGREVWLEVSLECCRLTLTEKGCKAEAACASHELPHAEEILCCHYDMELSEGQAVFHVGRTREDLGRLGAAAAALGVTRMFGLYQELGR